MEIGVSSDETFAFGGECDVRGKKGHSEQYVLLEFEVRG